MNYEGLSSIVDRYLPAARLTTVEPLHGGVSAKVLKLDVVLPSADETSFVIRVHEAGYEGLSAEREYRLLCRLHESSLRVPEPLMHGDRHSPIGCPYVLMSFIRGTKRFQDKAINRDIETIASYLAEIHSTPVEAFGFLPRRLEPLPELLDYLPTGEDWTDIRTFFEGFNHASSPCDLRLLHGDYWPENILWDQSKVIGILDWEDAALGDFHCDVAAACLELRYIDGPWTMDAFKQSYSRTRAIDESRFNLWLAYVCAAAQHFVGQWGIDPEREIHIRATARMCLVEAATGLGFQR